MLTRITDHFRGLLAGAVIASILWGCFIMAHTEYRVHFGNQREDVAQAGEQAVSIAKLMPAEKPRVTK